MTKVLLIILFTIGCSPTEPENVYGCTDSTACNFNSDANIFDDSCFYIEDCNGECNGTAELDCNGECNGTAELDCNGECGGNAVVDECGECEGPGYLNCWHNNLVCDLNECYEYNVLDIYDVWKQNTDLEPDINGYYNFEYVPTGQSDSDYGTLKYNTTIGVTRVYWESPDSFWVYHMGQWFGEPIINNSTYSSDEGFGQQLFYIDETFIGDTLSLYGQICPPNSFTGCDNSPLHRDSIFVIIQP